MRLMQGVFLLSLCLLIAFGACRRNQPTLVDKNEAPETELWYAPPDSVEYEYLVHLFWRGIDNDGTAVNFIWTIRDSLIEGELAWNPAERLRDFREGRMISRTDSVFSFRAFKEIEGLGVKKNRQAFLIAAIDDNGVIDPSPAVVEFIATIENLPAMHFTTYIRDTVESYVPLPVPKDTVGVMEPFSLSYHGTSDNGVVMSYLYFPLTVGVFLDGQNQWIDDLGDTLRDFPNTGDQMLPSGGFKFAARCKDEAGAESAIVTSEPYDEGVCQVVVNFDPETQFIDLFNYYHTTSGMQEEEIFIDDVPDTVPYRSFLRMRYWGEDDHRDGKIHCNELQPDSCINFQIAYRFRNPYEPAANEFSLWQPRTKPYHDTDSGSSTDSNTVHMGSLDYDLYVRALDEHERADGTPPSIHIVGNYQPVLDSVAVEDHLGNRIDLSTFSTLTWNFWKGKGWPYVCMCDTVDLPQAFCVQQVTDPPECQTKSFPENGGSLDYYKIFSFNIRAWGRDNPKDPPPTDTDALGSGIKSWNYQIMNDQGQVMDLGKSVPGWFEQKTSTGSVVINVLNDEIRWKVFYPGPITGPGDPMGDTVFENLPSWFGKRMTVILKGRDTRVRSITEFRQTMFLNGTESLINSFPDASLGRQTGQRTFAFQVELVR
jgi:hypothetical protein